MPKPLKPVVMLHGEDGNAIWLGSEEAVREAVAIHYGDDAGTLADMGWMFDVGWDRDTYERKRDFLAETGFTGWWEGCRGPAGGVETKKLRRAWRFKDEPAEPSSTEGER